MADLTELLKSKKVSTIVREQKSRPWTVERDEAQTKTPPRNPVMEDQLITLNPVKTESQLSHNPVKTESQLSHNPVKTESQLSHNPVMEKLLITLNPVTTESQTESRFGVNRVTTESQLSHKIQDYNTLVGNDRAVMLALFAAARGCGSVETPMFSRRAFSNQIGLSYEAIRSSIKRLLNFGILEKVQSAKGGPGARVSVRFSQRVFQEINLTESQLSHNPVTNPVTTESQLSHKLSHGRSSSSSLMYLEELKTTTTGDQPKLFESATILNSEWQRVDFSALSEIGFTQNHLLQIASQSKLKPEAVQDSVYAFAFDLRENGKAKSINTAPLNYFLGILRKGYPYAPPENYESPEQQALRKYLAFKKTEKAKQSVLEQELQDLEFGEWHGKLSESEKVGLCPSPMQEGPLRRGTLRNYFEVQVWPKLKAEITHASP